MNRSNLAELTRGVVAGAVGTLAMDVLWWRRARAAGSDDSFTGWEFVTGSEYESFADASAPGQVGHRMAALVGIDVPVQHAGLTTDVVHWATGATWGVFAGALAARTSLSAATAGIAGGVAAITTAYAALGAIGIYRPVWEDDRATLFSDASAHLVFGAATGVALATFEHFRSA